jgi:hypothetical protein
MFYTQFHDPRVTRWQGRLARVPRWGWIAFGIGVLVPIVLLIIGVIVVGVVTGAIVMAAVLLVGSIMGLIYRLFHKRDDGRRNVQIVVHSARVIDP